MAAGEVVDHGHIKTAIQQVAGGDGADVPGAPGYQDFRHFSHSTIEACASAAASLGVESRESQRWAPPWPDGRPPLINALASGAFTLPAACCRLRKFCSAMESTPCR